MGFFRWGSSTRKTLDEAIKAIRSKVPDEGHAYVAEHIGDAVEARKVAESVFKYIKSYELFLKAAAQACDNQDFVRAISMIEQAKEVNELITREIGKLKEYDQKFN